VIEQHPAFYNIQNILLVLGKLSIIMRQFAKQNRKIDTVQK